MVTLRADVLIDAVGREQPERVVNGLEVLCDDLARIDLSPLGRRLLQGEMLRALSTPMLSAPLRARTLIVVVGMPRSGTTLFHHLAAQHPAVWSMPFWQARSPALDERTAREEAVRYLGLLDTVAPEVRRLHPMHVDGPEECSTARQVTLRSERFWYLARVPRYLEWLETGSSAGWQEWLGCVAALSDGAGVVLLKDPAHLGQWQALAAPGCDVRIVRFLRDPLEVSTSFSRLIHALRSMSAATPPDPCEVSDEVTSWLARRLERELTASPTHPVLDVEMADLLADPVAITSEVLTWCGVPPAPSPPRSPEWLRPAPAPSGGPSRAPELSDAAGQVFARFRERTQAVS